MWHPSTRTDRPRRRRRILRAARSPPTTAAARGSGSWCSCWSWWASVPGCSSSCAAGGVESTTATSRPPRPRSGPSSPRSPPRSSNTRTPSTSAAMTTPSRCSVKPTPPTPGSATRSTTPPTCWISPNSTTTSTMPGGSSRLRRLSSRGALHRRRPSPTLPAACFFDPTHKPGTAEATLRTPAGEKEVRVCRSCAERLARGEQPEPRMIDVGGSRVPAAKAPRSHGGLGMGGLSVFEIILGGLAAAGAMRGGRDRREPVGGGTDWGDMLPGRGSPSSRLPLVGSVRHGSPAVAAHVGCRAHRRRARRGSAAGARRPRAQPEAGLAVAAETARAAATDGVRARAAPRRMSPPTV